MLGLPGPTMLALGIIGGVVLAAAAAIGARCSDRFGRRRMVLAADVATIGSVR